MNDAPDPMAERPADDLAGSTATRDRTRRRRRIGLIYSVTTVVALVLAATMTVAGPQRLTAVAVIAVGVIGMLAVTSLIRRASTRTRDAAGSVQPAKGADEKPSWVYSLGGPPTVLVGSFIRSAGSQPGGFGATVATGVAAGFLVVPLLLATDVALGRRRARKLAEQTESPLNERPNPRP